MTRTSHYAWMALGGILCLLGIFVASRVRDGNRAMAQTDAPMIVAEKPAPPPAPPEPPRMLPTISPEAPPVPAPVAEVVPAGAALPPLPQGATVTVDPPPAGSDTRPIVIPASATVPAPPTVPVPPPPPPGVTPPAVDNTPPPPPTVQAAIPDVVPLKEAAPEPPLAPNPGPVVQHRISAAGETLKTLARKVLGSADRWTDIHKLNPTLKPDTSIPTGTTVRLPGDACVTDDHESVRPLPSLRPRSAPKARAALPLTGTFPIAVDDHKVMALPRKIVEQLGNCDTVLLSPGSDRCLWLTNQSHLDRLQAKLDKSPARESDVRDFKRLYYAQTQKVPFRDGKVAISDKLAAFAGLGAEVVLVGIDDHFEIWDAARWRRYTQAKKATAGDD